MGSWQHSILLPALLSQAWHKTTDPAILFIDAVDELALRRKDLRDLLRKLDSAIAIDQRTVQVVITARTGMWLPEHTERLQRFLWGGGTTTPPISKLTFVRLDESALRGLALGTPISATRSGDSLASHDLRRQRP